MRNSLLLPAAAPSSAPVHRSHNLESPKSGVQVAERFVATYLNNTEAAEFLRLSPRTLEKQRVIGGGPRFHKFGRRVMYARVDLQAWANARSFEATCDPEYINAVRGAGAGHGR